MSTFPRSISKSLVKEAGLAWEAAEFLIRARSLDLEHGDGHPVLLLPAFSASMRALLPLERSLRALGYELHGWGQGRNLGLRTATLERLTERLDRIVQAAGQPASLIGWSAGGLYAREMARRRPAAVRRVITLGSPIRLEQAAPEFVERTRHAFEALLGRLGRNSFDPRPEPPPVPCTAIYSRRDGIVDWRCAMEQPGPQVENLEVGSSHLGYVCNIEVLRVIADRLARPALEPRNSARRRRRAPD